MRVVLQIRLLYPRAREQNKRQELEVEQSTSTLERSLHSDLAGRVHFHWKVNLKTTLDEPSTLLFAFHGVRPDARPTFVTAATKQARGANFAEASHRGHFYTCRTALAVSAQSLRLSQADSAIREAAE